MDDSPKNYWTKPVDMTVGTINWEETLRFMKERAEEEARNPPPMPVHIVSLRTYNWLVKEGIIRPLDTPPVRELAPNFSDESRNSKPQMRPSHSGWKPTTRERGNRE